MKLAECISVAPRYSRAINLERDLHSEIAVDGYVLTSSGIDCVRRIADGLQRPAAGTAWTLTGPYGTGKSAFALFLTRLLAARERRKTAVKLLRSRAPELAETISAGRAVGHNGFCPVVVSASNEPLVDSLLSSCIRQVRRFARGRTLKSLKELEKLQRRRPNVQSKAFVAAITEVIVELRNLRLANGLLVVIDELGKSLEHAARNSGDIFVLQELAESSASFREPGLLLITLLHQSFEQYAAGLRSEVRNEWAKVQGRFVDVAFQDPPEQVLYVLANAITQRPCAKVKEYRTTAAALAMKVYDAGIAPKGFTKKDFVALSALLTPIHPITALCLTHLCRKFGQNQRSLFAFLLSRETNGFAGFLEEDAGALFSPAQLYDYIVSSFGSATLIGDGAGRWAETQAILQQHVDLGLAGQEIVKTVGLLTAIGAHGNLLPKPEVVKLAASPGHFEKTCKELVRRSILVHRKHSGAFALWQGSDVDIEERLQEAQRRVPLVGTLASRMRSCFVPPPVVAKRHSFRTGTLRFFKVRFAAASEVCAYPNAEESDGTLLYVLPDSEQDRLQSMELAVSSQFKSRTEIIVAIPTTTEPLKHAFRDVELLQWVIKNTAELQSDSVARRELRTRLMFAQRQLEFETQRLFSPSAVTQTCWFQAGVRREIPSTRLLSQMVSDICDQVYNGTPIIRNELLNRRTLSSAAAAARRNLIEGMLRHASEARLGIGGNPPEFSMYVSVLKASGMHREVENGRFELGPPLSTSSLFPVWSRIEQFFVESELQRECVTKLYDILAGPPFGLKQGIIPVLFCTSLLCHDTDVALYEQGAFVPEISTDVFERLLKGPADFEVRSYRVSGVRKQVFDQYAAAFDAQKAANLVAVVRPLFRFFNRLPDYSKRTATVSAVAIAVRDALFAAKEPDILLFQQLPVACGFEPFSSTEEEVNPQKYFKVLREAIGELQRTYDDLLAHITDVLFGAFGVNRRNGRNELQARARAIAEYAVEPRMRALLLHLTDTDLAEVLWIEAIATLCAGKPPRAWTDTDRARYQVVISDLTRSFKHLEAMMFEVSRAAAHSGVPAQVLRLGVTDQFAAELETVITVSFENMKALAELKNSLEAFIASEASAVQKNVVVAALALVAKKLITEERGVTAQPVAS